jgi:UDP-perosamine 4-acetyltransferase
MSSARKKIVGLGAGGHAKVVIDILRTRPDVEIVGLLAPRHDGQEASIQGVQIIGGDDLLPSLVAQGVAAAFIGVGGAGSNRKRRLLYDLVRQNGLELVSAIHDRAIVSPSARIAAGVSIFAGAIVNAAARIGVNVIVNTGAIVEHDVVLGDHVHVSTGARLGGGVTVGEAAYIGMGAVVRHGIDIGASALVGAGAVVVDDVPDRVVVVGVPARVIRTVEDV